MMSTQTDVAYKFLKDKILDGTYKPSQRLTETDLAQVVGVSRNTVRQALLKLEQENLVEIELNKGARIKSFTLDEILNYLQIREVLEGLVARTAAAHIQEFQLKKMEDLLTSMREHVDKNELDEYSAKNREFHNVIYSASRNSQAVDLITMIKTQLNRYHLRTILVPGRTTDSLLEHQTILDALRKRDGEAADHAIRIHIAHIRETIEKNYNYLL
jgi:DNA-binding GntR family transcriptional regulator